MTGGRSTLFHRANDSLSKPNNLIHSILATNRSFRDREGVSISEYQYNGHLGDGCSCADLPVGWKRDVLSICQSTGQCLKDSIVIKSRKTKFLYPQAPKPIFAVHFKSFFEPLPLCDGVLHISQRMSPELVHQRWQGTSEVDAPLWVSEGWWILANDGAGSHKEMVNFEVVPRAIGLRMARESSEYGGYPIGGWATISYNILMDGLIQALRDYLTKYLTAVQTNPAYRLQVDLPRDQHIPVSDPSGPWDNLEMMLLGSRMACLDPEHDVLSDAGAFIKGMSLSLKFEAMFSSARASLPGPSRAH
ncbi:uncharacterized protein EI90DRAFT_3138464 [Cantharellus anzutake]|uniref:uncharacterized protein n=1 Tax=Cantharellus anzutake TaxID=1750568 RepID=UPI0019069F16|nr:uncharacterized protein EI90DRAFT_3138464 [Cantharellus anzutake]KAF8311329.1 hypothetical protein EI90DRAFT_3138464 [Cantharellus anzutake]